MTGVLIPGSHVDFFVVPIFASINFGDVDTEPVSVKSSRFYHEGVVVLSRF